MQSPVTNLSVDLRFSRVVFYCFDIVKVRLNSVKALFIVISIIPESKQLVFNEGNFLCFLTKHDRKPNNDESQDHC